MAHKEYDPGKPINFASKPERPAYLRAVNINRANPASNVTPLLLNRPMGGNRDHVNNVRLLQATGILISIIWLVGASFYIQRMIGWQNISGLKPHEMGGFLAGILTPVALFWMIAAFIMRSNDVKIYAEALREEIQGMIFPSEEANRRVNNDIERLMRQTAEMSKATHIALSSIETAREGLRTQVNLLNTGSTETVDRLTTLGLSLSARMQDVAQVGAALEQSLGNIEQSTINAEEKLEAANKNLQNSAELIGTNTQSTEEAVGKISQMLRDRLEALGSLHQQTEEVLKNAATEIASQRETLKVDTDALENKAQSIGDALRKGTDKLYAFSDEALDKAKLIEMKLEGQTTSLQNVLAQANDNASAIESATDEAVEKLQGTTTNLSNEVNKIEDVLENAINNLNKRSQETAKQVRSDIEDVTDRLITGIDDIGTRTKGMTDEMLTEVTRKVSDTTAAFSYIQNQIQALVGLFDQRKLQLDETGLSARQTAEAMHQTLQAALDKVQKTTAVLQTGIGTITVAVQEPIALLESAANMAHQRAGDIAELLNKQTQNVTASVREMGDHADEVQQNLHSKSQDVALLAGKIAGHLKMIGHEMDVQTERLDIRLEKSVDALSSLNLAQKNLANDVGTLEEKTTKIIDQTEVSSENIKQKIELLQQLHKSLATDTDTSKASLDRVSDRIVTISTGTLDNIKNTLENMTLLEADYHRMSEAGVESIEKLEKGYRNTLGNVQTETEETAKKIIDLQNDLQNSTMQTNHFMQAHLSNLQHTAENLGQTVSKVSEFGDTIALHTTRIGDFGSDFLQGNEQISIHVRSLQDVLGQMKDHTIEAVDSFMQHGADVENQMQNQISRLNNVNQDLILNSSEFKNTLTENINNTADLSQKITTQLGQIRLEGETVETALGSVLDSITNASSKMMEQRTEMVESNDEILDRLQKATQQIGNKAAALEKAAQEAQAQAEALRAQEQKLNHEAFFNSTKFIVESLHSLALDFTRMLDGELNEKTWRGYQKGDNSAFTRHMLSTRDDQTQSKIRGKFKEDVEFRTYVQRYLRQFEEIYDSAERNDHAHLLSSVFMTSDVGKLYQFICATLERDARGVKA